MTWADLRGALAARGLVREDRGGRAGAGFVTGIAYDSRRVEPGNVFVAVKGRHADGTAFARQAIERGAALVVAEAPPPAAIEAPWIVVSDARLALAVLAAAYFRHPSAELQVVGITGTNGKTTTAYLVASILEAAGRPCGILGTVVYRVGRRAREATHTTPEAPELQALLREMVSAGCSACAMEVSSHALALRRADEIRFAAGIFTNLTRDHLDFHADMDDYFRAKRRLFEMLPPGAPAVVNLDDPRGPALAASVPRAVTYAVNQPADVSPGPLACSLDGLSFEIRTPRARLHARSPLVGRANVSNILAAAAAALALDAPPEAVERGIQALEGVPGRFQVVSTPHDEVTVVVDYAHTDDALRSLLETARPLARGRLITLFGCGGDRDRTKRPLMGAVAARLSDVVIVTSDNPRHEDPAEIIEEICRGLAPEARAAGPLGAAAGAGRERSYRVLTIVDRGEAIRTAIDIARPGDLVLIAGKGHEKTQIIGDRALPFDDVAAAREALVRRRSRSRVG